MRNQFLKPKKVIKLFLEKEFGIKDIDTFEIEKDWEGLFDVLITKKDGTFKKIHTSWQSLSEFMFKHLKSTQRINKPNPNISLEGFVIERFKEWEDEIRLLIIDAFESFIKEIDFSFEANILTISVCELDLELNFKTQLKKDDEGKINNVLFTHVGVENEMVDLVKRIIKKIL